MIGKFDIADYVRKLESAGVPRQQAELHAQALAAVIDKVAQEPQLLSLQYNLQNESYQSESRLISQVAAARSTLSAEIELQNAKTDHIRTELSAKVDALKSFLDSRMQHGEGKRSTISDGVRSALSLNLWYIYVGTMLGILLTLFIGIMFF
ncbi:DUF1640 domain-containing protein [Massilia antarctica]|uniref:DUF1640 domain-containing protein n=1 Tax=Massilia antarctica TaxID=2765360 RepID=UPI0006BB968C|nr:DUF1640 domain-containing protein [Massilia sp. H27-R4]MCY0915317.1 DUF1640 domain-containing protein [Massilia sp. H27-R4]